MADARFEGRRALVTGAGSGIGEAVARALHAEGAEVVLADAAGERVEALAGELGSRAQAVTLDVRDEDAVAAAMGEPRRAGQRGRASARRRARPTRRSRCGRTSSRSTRAGRSCAASTRSPAWSSAGAGRSSTSPRSPASSGLPNRAAYCASKGAVIALTRALAIDHVGQGVRVNAVCPGTVDSPWVRRLVDDVGESLDALRARQPMGRLGTHRGGRPGGPLPRVRRRRLRHGDGARDRRRPDRRVSPTGRGAGVGAHGHRVNSIVVQTGRKPSRA